MFAPLSSARIADYLGELAPAIAVELVAETGSTNADLLARVLSRSQLSHTSPPSPPTQRSLLNGPVLRVAARQSAGRGRAGRSWHADADTALTFSLAWPFRQQVQTLAGLPLAVGVALAETLQRLGIDARLKWPNDVLLNGAKLAGILVETASPKAGDRPAAPDAQDARVWAVIGIGLNLAQPAELAAGIGREVASAPSLLIDRNRALAEITADLSRALTLFEQEGLAAFIARWTRLDAYAGQPVQILDHDLQQAQGVARGIDRHGRLLLDTASGQITVVAGDVSLRPLESKHAAID